MDAHYIYRPILSIILLGVLTACGAGGESSGSSPPPLVSPSPQPDPEAITPSTVEFTRVEYGERPILYVLVDFSDWTTMLDEETHFRRMYFENFGVWDYYRRLFKGRIEITAPAETYGTANDGIIRVRVDQPHPNDPQNFEAMTAAVVSTARQIDEYVDATAFDKDGNGYLTPDELTIAFVVAGRSICRGAGCVGDPLPQVRGFARTSFFESDDRKAIVLGGIDVPHFNVQPERGVYTFRGIEDSSAVVTLVHEIGHSVFGVSDHYGEYSNGGEFVNFLNEWCLLSEGRLRRPSDDFIGPQIMAGYTRLETNLIRAVKIQDDATVALDSAATSSLAADRTDSSLARVWLDPYEVRESIVLEYRDNKGYDSFLGGRGALLTQVQSLAINSKQAPPNYRRARLIEGSGYDGSRGVGQFGQFTERSDTPGFADNPMFTPRTVTLRYDGLSENTAVFDLSVEDFGPERGYLRYDVAPGDESNLFARNTSYGFTGESKAFAGTIMVNDTNFDTIDGYEIVVQGDSTLTFEVYESILDDGTPFNLLTTESAKVTGAGWMRIFLDNPLSFRPGEARFVTIGIETPSVTTFVLPKSRVGDRAEYDVQSYVSLDGLRYGEPNVFAFRKILLLSQQMDP